RTSARFSKKKVLILFTGVSLRRRSRRPARRRATRLQAGSLWPVACCSTTGSRRALRATSESRRTRRGVLLVLVLVGPDLAALPAGVLAGDASVALGLLSLPPLPPLTRG